MKKTITREITINECDFCSEEMDSFNRCAICKKEMCLNKHAAFSLEVFCYEGGARLAGPGSHICNDCANEPIHGTTLSVLLNRMVTGKHKCQKRS